MVATYSGVRPLYDDHAASASKVTRDFVLHYDTEGGAPILSVFGGKITTYRELAEEAVAELAPLFEGLPKTWTRHASLPGGDIPAANFDAYLSGLVIARPHLPIELLTRLARAYGTRTYALLGKAETLADLGRDFGGGLTEREVQWLVEQEFARSAEDILHRRSKLYLHMTREEQAAFTDWFNTSHPAAA